MPLFVGGMLKTLCFLFPRNSVILSLNGNSSMSS